MKNALLTSAAIVAFASAASAFEIAPGLSAGADVVTAYTVDAKDVATTLTPTLSYNWSAISLSASTDLSVWNNGWVGNTMFDVKPTIDLEAIFAAQDNVELSLETSYDIEAADRGEITLTATLSF
jgi:hypothetical protein